MPNRLLHTRDGDPILGLKLGVSQSVLHVNTLRERVLHFRFEAALDE